MVFTAAAVLLGSHQTTCAGGVRAIMSTADRCWWTVLHLAGGQRDRRRDRARVLSEKAKSSNTATTETPPTY
ncbi:hypothetical protein BaRGS_00038961 [Batillaria attramentaria]|uniref:Secreted protein n=1 Tax=Batillaria attramentaria TaxID=370345 RepID=A0ABD0J4C5_9CAEN